MKRLKVDASGVIVDSSEAPFTPTASANVGDASRSTDDKTSSNMAATIPFLKGHSLDLASSTLDSDVLPLILTIRPGIIGFSYFDLCFCFFLYFFCSSSTNKLLDWTPSSVAVSRYTDGITNIILKCKHQDSGEVILARIYGQNTEV